jgi:hypothetical protein
VAPHLAARIALVFGDNRRVTVDDHIRFERLVHQLLASWRNQGAGQRREIFHLPADDAFASACEMRQSSCSETLLWELKDDSTSQRSIASSVYRLK